MADVRVEVDLDTSKAESEAKTFKGKMEGVFGDIAKVAGGILAAGAAQQIGGFLKSAVEGAMEEEAATKRLEQALRNAGGAFDENTAKVNAAIDAGQKKAFTDDQVRDSFQQLLAATGDVNEALDRQKLAMDLSRGAGISLEQASKMVGKVTEENVDAFKRMGINIKDGATEAEALATVQAKFAGQSDAYAQSTAGQFEQAKIRMSEVKEEIGMQLLPVITKLGLVFLNDVVPAIEAFVTAAKPKIKAVVDFIQNEVMPVVKEQFGKFQDYYESDIKPALDNIKTAIEGVVAFIKEHWGQIEPFVRPIFIGIQTAAEVAFGLIKVAIDLLGGDWKGAVEGMRDIWNTITDGFKDAFNAAKDQILVAVGLLKDGFEGIAGAIQGAFSAAIGEIIGLINKAIEAYNKIPLAPNVSTIGSGGGGSSQGFDQRTGSGGGADPGQLMGQRENSEMLGRPIGSYSGGMGDPSVNYVDPRGETLTANDILARRGVNDGFTGAPPIVINVGTINARDSGEARMAAHDIAYTLATAGLAS